MKTVALDLGKFNSTMCRHDSKTRKASFMTVATQRDYLKRIFDNCDADLVVMEACGPSGWISDLAQSQGLKTLVCSTNEEAWRWANVERKTDKDDAFKLARMAAMGELKGVHVPSLEHLEFRSSVKYGKTLDQRINKTKNTIRAKFCQSRDRDRLRRTAGRTIRMNTKERSLARYQHTTSQMLRSSLQDDRLTEPSSRPTIDAIKNASDTSP
ncbi:MAG: transposase [Pirellulaceae bacterium]